MACWSIGTVRRASRAVAAVLGACAALGLAGCEGKPSKACHQRMAEAQVVVAAVDAESLASVEQCLSAIDAAKRTCASAGLDSETGELSLAEERFRNHRTRLLEREAKRTARASITPERLAELTRNGDPDCPKGQGYVHQASGKEIKCTGLLPVDMPAAQARKYFEKRGLHEMKNAEPGTVSMELGAERVILRYPPGAETSAPSCLIVQPKPGISWQEAVARVTGTPPDRLKQGGSITSSRGPLMLSVDEQNVVARLGDCPPSAQGR
jgi:hypothetical protein